ncbi:MAG: hypothetical protein Q8M24_00405 [Pseudolabrys sp.]|nr:hypothetical protein [Pseudolabrys sp.]MDP2293908.1 hypothetical protein [Pseudolabrys sp.]
MRQKSARPESSSERIVKNIRRATRKRHSPEEKIRIVLDGLRGEALEDKSPKPRHVWNRIPVLRVNHLMPNAHL